MNTLPRHQWSKVRRGWWLHSYSATLHVTTAQEAGSVYQYASTDTYLYASQFTPLQLTGSIIAFRYCGIPFMYALHYPATKDGYQALQYDLRAAGVPCDSGILAQLRAAVRAQDRVLAKARVPTPATVLCAHCERPMDPHEAAHGWSWQLPDGSWRWACSPGCSDMLALAAETDAKPEPASATFASCAYCSRSVDTREEVDGGDPWGWQLPDGRWACSPGCWAMLTEDTVAVHP